MRQHIRSADSRLGNGAITAMALCLAARVAAPVSTPALEQAIHDEKAWVCLLAALVAAFALWARRRHTFEPSARTVDGMTMVPLPRHTSGHARYEFESEGHNVFLSGDTVHSLSAQLPAPDVTAVVAIPTPAQQQRSSPETLNLWPTLTFSLAASATPLRALDGYTRAICRRSSFWKSGK